MPAKFFEEDIKSGLKDKRRLSAFLDGLVKQHRAGIKSPQLTYIFCDDLYLAEMNMQYLDHNTFTDIITFDLSGSKQEMQGEIYISVDRVKENAEKFKTTYIDELHRVIFHGALHLCGFKDKKAADKKVMREKENESLAAYNSQ
ncbi:MAG: rRNA maturation RNase YbeY [Bacteroidota bacterium]